jgi:hypothetical protein
LYAGSPNSESVVPVNANATSAVNPPVADSHGQPRVVFAASPFDPDEAVPVLSAAPSYAPEPVAPYATAPVAPVSYSAPVTYHHHHRTRRTVVVRRRPFSHSVAIVGGSALGGAGVGALVGGGPGAIVGGLTGGIGGLIYDRKTHKKKKVIVQR